MARSTFFLYQITCCSSFNLAHCASFYILFAYRSVHSPPPPFLLTTSGPPPPSCYVSCWRLQAFNFILLNAQHDFLGQSLANFSSYILLEARVKQILWRTCSRPLGGIEIWTIVAYSTQLSTKIIFLPVFSYWFARDSKPLKSIFVIHTQKNWIFLSQLLHRHSFETSYRYKSFLNWNVTLYYSERPKRSLARSKCCKMEIPHES